MKCRGKVLSYNNNGLISDIFNENQKYKVEVFIISQEKQKIEIELDKYLNCKTIDGEPIKLVSKDKDQFKDSYSLEYLFQNFNNPEVLD